MQNRRSFLKQFAGGIALAGLNSLPLEVLAKEPEITKLTILHTNDVHSRIEPFESGRNKGLGGAARRAALIKEVRQKEKNVLLLDAGDIIQGTPYFNYFGGELEFKLMEKMGYDAATIGNHDFDGGIEGLHRQLSNFSFPLLSANYDFSDTIMNNKTLPYQIFKKDGIKIGVFGLGIELDGLVPKNLYKNTVYLDPFERANHYAQLLKEEEKCDYVICLSHLGYKSRSNAPSDLTLAAQSTNIDLIIGGHSHTFLKQPDVLKNAEGKAILVNQVGWGGIYLGRIDVFFEKNKKGRCATCNNLLVGPSNTTSG